MKILQINCVYGTGSTGRLTEAIHTRLLAEGIKSVVCCGRGPRSTDPHVHKVCGELYAKAQHAEADLTGLVYGGCVLSTARLLHILRREAPDIVHLQCINGYFVNIFRLVRWLKRHRIPTLLTLHAEFPYTANCGIAADCEKWRTGCGSCPQLRAQTGSLLFDRTAAAWKRMRDAFAGFSNCTVVSVSPWLRGRAEQAPVLAGLHHVTIGNGVETAVFHPMDAADLRQRYISPGCRLVLHVTASFSPEQGSLKGGWYVLALAKRMPDVTFAVVGNREPLQNVPDNVLDIGRLEDPALLAAWYCAADAALLTSRRETFSLVTAESLCCGTPVVGFRAGGPESIAPPSCCEFVEYGDLDALEHALRSRLEATPDRAAIAADAAARFSMENMYRAYKAEYTALSLMADKLESKEVKLWKSRKHI